MPSTDAKRAALAYHDAGLCILPVRKDGTKRPDVQAWSEYQKQRPPRELVKRWFLRCQGVGIVCGQVSGNLEVIDFDDAAVFPQWQAKVEALAPGLLATLPQDRSPRGAPHVYYRCPTIEGNLKLARVMDGENVKVLIETRGEGGFIVCAPTTGAYHETGRPYVLTNARLSKVPVITVEQRQVLLDCARQFNSYEPIVLSGANTENTTIATNGDRPGDAWARHTPWEDILKGWTKQDMRGEVCYWKRPNKQEPGASATTGYNGKDNLHVFSTAAQPFEAEQSYTKFAAYALLHHQGNFGAAAADLAAQGYGKQKTALAVEDPPWLTDAPELSDIDAMLPPPQSVRKTNKNNLLSLADLLGTEFPAPVWVVPEMLPVGLALLAGRPKLGKSFLGLQLSIAVGAGGMFLDRKVTTAKALYVALEDSPRRLQKRLVQMSASADGQVDFAFSWPPLNGEGLYAIQAELEEGYRLIVVDTLSRSVKGAMDWDDVAQVTRVMGALQKTALDNDACLLLIDHHRKPGAQGADAIDDVLGSTGKSAVADTIWGLYRKRGEHGATLQVTGRDIEEAAFKVSFDGITCCWQVDNNISNVQQNILDALGSYGALTVTALAEELGVAKPNVSRELGELVHKGIARKRTSARTSPYELVSSVLPI